MLFVDVECAPSPRRRNRKVMDFLRIQERAQIIVSKPDTILMEWQSPAFTPQQPMIVTVYSKVSIKTERIESIPFNFPHPAGYLK
jgi:hypothetical protein